MAFGGMLECCVKGDGPPARREVRTWRGSYWAASDQACAAGITGAEAGHGLPLTDWGAQNSPPPPGAVLEQRLALISMVVARLDPFTLVLCEGP